MKDAKSLRGLRKVQVVKLDTLEQVKFMLQQGQSSSGGPGITLYRAQVNPRGAVTVRFRGVTVQLPFLQ
jgi:hypothetical protein